MSIKVGLFNYEVDKTRTKKQLQKDAGVDYAIAGWMDDKGKKIWVASDISSRQQESTLIHEIFEAIGVNYLAGLREHQVVKLEQGLFLVLQSLGIRLSDHV